MLVAAMRHCREQRDRQRLKRRAADGIWSGKSPTGDYLERMAELIRAKVDVIVVDTAHGHSSRVLQARLALRLCKSAPWLCASRF